MTTTFLILMPNVSDQIKFAIGDTFNIILEASEMLSYRQDLEIAETGTVSSPM